MSAEMTIRLIDGTAEEQAAFDRSPEDFNRTLERLSVDLASVQRSVYAKTVSGSQTNTANDTKLDTDSPTSDDYRELRQSMTELVRQFTPKFFAEPIEKLIQSFAPRTTGKHSDRANEQLTTSPAGPTVESTFNNVIMTANQVIVKGLVKSEPVDSMGGGRGAEFRKSIVKKIESTKVGRVAMRAARSFRSTVRSAGKSISKTRFGKAVAGLGRRAVGSSFGRAIAGIGGRLLGTAATTAAAGTSAAAGAGAAAGTGAIVAGGTAATLATSVVPPVALTVAAFTALAASASFVGSRFKELGEDFKEFSPELQRVDADRQVAREVNMVARNRAIGDDLARLDASKAEVEDARTQAYTKLLDYLSKLAIIPEKLNNIETGIWRMLGLAEDNSKPLTQEEIRKLPLDDPRRQVDFAFFDPMFARGGMNDNGTIQEEFQKFLDREAQRRKE